MDGKLLPDASGTEILDDRLPLLVTLLADGKSKLLHVPKLSSGSERAAAEAIYEHLRSWGCNSLVFDMCFDTTAVNTGRLPGACRLLEDAVGKHLLWLACRHHILETLLIDVFTACFGPSSGPKIFIFKRFRDCWHKLNHQQPVIRSTPLVIAPDAVKNFILLQLQQTHSSDD